MTEHRHHFTMAIGGMDCVCGEKIRADGGPSYTERHGHSPLDPCDKFCRGNPATLGGNGGPTAAEILFRLGEAVDLP